ncbi:MAG: homocysteine S-methyltransferase family protein [Chloroflexota bacterium]
MRAAIPGDPGRRYLTDGGLETTLVFHLGRELPAFAAFPLLDTEDGRATLRGYFTPYLALARARRTALIIDTPTWRANRDWGAVVGYDAAGLERINREAVAFARAVAADAPDVPTIVNGMIGPRGDGYVVADPMDVAAAEAYHGIQMRSFAAAGADLVTALTLSYPAEGAGVARAAQAAGLPAVISFTVETDGRLPDGTPLGTAITDVDAAAPGAVAYFMVNCAHPGHFRDALAAGGAWTQRIRGVRANASAMSHAELDVATELDAGDPADLGRRYAEIDALVGGLAVLGGCCGTDDRHVAAIDAAVPRRGA